MSGSAKESNGTESASPVKEPSLWSDLWEIAGIVAILAITAMAATWAVWYFTTEPGNLNSARPVECGWDSLEKCFSLSVVNKMITHAAIVGGIGGAGRYAMFRAAERRAEAAERRAEAEREAREAAERRLDAEREARDAERQRADAERQRADAERQRADAERQALFDQIAALTARIANGNQEQTNT